MSCPYPLSAPSRMISWRMSLAWSNRNLSIGAMNAKNKVKGIKTLNQKDTSYLSSRLMDTRTGNSDFARTRAMSMTPVNANEFYDITSRTNALSKSALQLDKGAMESFNQKTKAAINAFAVSALHQDNRRIAVEKRFDMCSTYSSIIGAAVVYLISLSDDPNQALCSTMASWAGTPSFGVHPLFSLDSSSWTGGSRRIKSLGVFLLLLRLKFKSLLCKVLWLLPLPLPSLSLFSWHTSEVYLVHVFLTSPQGSVTKKQSSTSAPQQQQWRLLNRCKLPQRQTGQF